VDTADGYQVRHVLCLAWSFCGLSRHISPLASSSPTQFIYSDEGCPAMQSDDLDKMMHPTRVGVASYVFN